MKVLVTGKWAQRHLDPILRTVGHEAIFWPSGTGNVSAAQVVDYMRSASIKGFISGWSSQRERTIEEALRDAQVSAYWEDGTAVSPPSGVIRLCEDKSTAYAWLESEGFKVPYWRLETAKKRDSVRSVPGPLVVKPPCSDTSWGMQVFENAGKAYEWLSRVSGVFIAQSMIAGEEFGVEYLFHPQGILHSVTVLAMGRADDGRLTPPHRRIRWGPVSLPKGLARESTRLGHALESLSPWGCIQVDMILSADDTVWVVDVNARLSGLSSWSATQGSDPWEILLAISTQSGLPMYHDRYAYVEIPMASNSRPVGNVLRHSRFEGGDLVGFVLRDQKDFNTLRVDGYDDSPAFPIDWSQVTPNLDIGPMVRRALRGGVA